MGRIAAGKRQEYEEAKVMTLDTNPIATMTEDIFAGHDGL